MIESDLLYMEELYFTALQVMFSARELQSNHFACWKTVDFGKDNHGAADGDSSGVWAWKR